MVGYVSPGAFSRYQAAARPCLPFGVRTPIHWLIAPICVQPFGSVMVNKVPAGTVSTTLALLEVSSLLRTLRPKVTSSLTRACGPVATGAGVGWSDGLVVPEGEGAGAGAGAGVATPGSWITPSAAMFSKRTICIMERWRGFP